MAIKKKSEVLQKKPTADVDADDEDEDDGSTSEAPAPESDEDETPTPKTKTKEKVEPTANETLVGLIETYDESVEVAEKSFIEMVEHIQDKQLDRATVIASMMRARGIAFEAAQTQYSKMKKIFNNEEVLAELKAGKITLKVAHQKTTKKQANPAAAKPEAKEANFTNKLKSFVLAAKESGFSRAEILVTVTAELKAAEIK